MSAYDLQTVHVGDSIRVPWSNGAGHSIYLVIEPDGDGPHRFVEMSKREVGEPETVWLCVNEEGNSRWFAFEDGSTTATLSRREAAEDTTRYRAQGKRVVEIARPIWQPTTKQRDALEQCAAWLRVVRYDREIRDLMSQLLKSEHWDSTTTSEFRTLLKYEFGLEVPR